MLLPVDLREWVTDDESAHFVIEAVDRDSDTPVPDERARQTD